MERVEFEAINRGITLTELVEDALRREIQDTENLKNIKSKLSQNLITPMSPDKDKTSEHSKTNSPQTGKDAQENRDQIGKISSFNVTMPSTSGMLMPSIKDSTSLLGSMKETSGLLDSTSLLGSIKDSTSLLGSIKETSGLLDSTSLRRIN